MSDQALNSVIDQLRVKNFKVLFDLEVDGLAPITLIGGKNNCGKSTMLEAAHLFLNWTDPAALLRHLSWRGIHEYRGASEHMFAAAFSKLDVSRSIQLSGLIRQAEPEPSVPGQHRLSLSWDSTMKGRVASMPGLGRKGESQLADETFVATGIKFHYTSDAERPNRSNLETNGAGVFRLKGLDVLNKLPTLPKTTYVGTRSRQSPKDEAELLGELELDLKARLLIEPIRIIEPNLSDLSTISFAGTSIIHANLGFPRMIPIYLLGDGVQRALQISMAIAHCQGGVALIDDIDSGLHHSVLKPVWESIIKACKTFQCQVIATTHSYSCLEAAAECFESRDQEAFAFIRLDREGERIVPRRYDIETLATAIENGWEVR